MKTAVVILLALNIAWIIWCGMNVSAQMKTERSQRRLAKELEQVREFALNGHGLLWHEWQDMKRMED